MFSKFAKNNIDLKAQESIWRLKARKSPQPEKANKAAPHQQQELCQAILRGVLALGKTFENSPIFAKDVVTEIKASESIWKQTAMKSPKPEKSNIAAPHQQRELCQAILQGVLGITFENSAATIAQDIVADIKAPASIWKLKTKQDSKPVSDRQQRDFCDAILRGVQDLGWESADLSKLGKIFDISTPKQQDAAAPTSSEDEDLLQKQRQLCNSILRNMMEVTDFSDLSPFAKIFKPQTKDEEKAKCFLVMNERGLYVPVYLTDSKINQDQEAEEFYSSSEDEWQSSDDQAQQWFPQEYYHSDSDTESLSSYGNEEMVQPLYRDQNGGYYSSEESDGAVYYNYYSDNESLPSDSNEDQMVEFYCTSEEHNGAVYYHYDFDEEQNLQYEEMDQNEGYYSCEESDWESEEWQSCDDGYQFQNAVRSNDQYWSDAQICAWSSEFDAENVMY